MNKPKVLLLGKIEHAHATWSTISNLATVIVPQSTTRQAFVAELASGALDGCVACYRTFDSVALTGKFDAELVPLLPDSLRFVCHNGAGYDQVDVTACTARGIRVSNAPTAVDDATADIGLWLMLGALRNLNSSIASLRAGEWRGKRLPALGHDPQGKVLGILGMGGIGRNMARKAKAFGMKITYHNRSRLDESLEQECGEAEYRGFDELFRESDVLSLNLPLNTATHQLVSTPQFALMKPGVVIVNTARGGVMDEAALVAPLEAGRVGSAGLDVFEEEPKVHPGLLKNPRVLLVPHMGTWTVETQTKMEEWTMGNVRMALLEGKLRSIVPEQRVLQEES